MLNQESIKIVKLKPVLTDLMQVYFFSTFTNTFVIHASNKPQTQNQINLKTSQGHKTMIQTQN